MICALESHHPIRKREFSPLGESPPSQESQVSVIRKELVALTGNHFRAVILNQLLYWTQRVKDFDLLLVEERSFCSDLDRVPCHGWIYKTANELNEETMLGLSHPTIRKYLKQLVEQGWIYERAHPYNKWNKTTQYRVNLKKVQEGLVARGCSLPATLVRTFSSFQEGEAKLPTPAPSNEETTNVKNLHSDENSTDTLLSPLPSSKKSTNVRNLQPKEEDFDSNVRNLHSNVRIFHSNVENLRSNTENTTKIITKNTNRKHTQRTCARGFFDEIHEIWKTHIGQDVCLTSERKRQLKSILAVHFQNDFQLWDQFCERVKTSPFLMGGGPRKWRVSLDWILVEENLLKVLEGNFDDPESFDQKKEETSETNRKEEISAILASIEDPIWMEWCSQLDFSLESRKSVSLGELKEISQARFLEVEDGKLVWIGSLSKRTLDRIENLRMKILPIIQATFPHIRTLRTRFCEELTASQKKEPFPPLENRSVEGELYRSISPSCPEHVWTLPSSHSTELGENRKSDDFSHASLPIDASLQKGEISHE